MNAIRRVPAVTELFIASAIYLALGWLGLTFAIAPGYASPIFPAAGFAIAMLLRSDGRLWPAVWLGSFALNVGVAALQGQLEWRSSLIATGIASGATLQALAAWWLVVRGIGKAWQKLENEQDIFRCLTLAGPVACVISATVGATSLYAAQVLPGNEYFYALCNWWGGDTLGVLVMLPLSLTVMYRRQSPWSARVTTLVLPMLVALGLVAGAFITVSKWERQQILTTVGDHGEALAQRLQQRFIAHTEALSALRRLIEVIPDMSYAQFDYFTRITLKDNPDIFALSINPYVLGTQRPSFEHSMTAKTGKRDFEIRERDSQGRLARAADRAEYVSVGYIAPLEGNWPAVGYDINSEPIRQDAIRRARQSGEPAITAPIQLVQENRQRPGVLVMHPAYQTGGTRGTGQAALLGFAVGVIKVDEMVEIATRDIAIPGLVFRLEDTLAPSEKSRLYNSAAASDPPDDNYTWRTQIAMADRSATLTVFPTTAYLRQTHHWAALLVGAGGLVLAALLQTLLLVITGQATIVRRKISEQTADLQAKSRALEDRNAQLNALFFLSPDGFISFDNRHRVNYVSPAFSRLTGLDEALLVGLDEAAFSEKLAALCLPSARFPGIDDLTRRLAPEADGARRQLIELASPVKRVLEVGLRLSDAETVSQILYFRDVTHETEVDRMKSEFLSTAAHELRTPMASIYGFSEILMADEYSAEERHEFLGVIHRQSELMISIINELLDLVRIEARRGKDFEIERIEACALIDEIVAAFKPPQGRAAPLRTACAAPCWIRGDRKKLMQAVGNVLSNAYKYSPQGGDVAIEVGPEADPGARPTGVAIRITDHGIGMTPEQQARVGERFYRADASGSIPGTGLGMSIVKEIVSLHGGELRMESRPGEGTCVTLLLATDMPGGNQSKG